MPTFNPTPFDDTKPETQPAVPTTADQRAQHTNGNTSFTDAYADVAALETGKEDTGVAAGLVNSHNTSPSAHPGTFDAAGSAATVQGNLDTHVADLGNPHAVTAAQASAIPDILTSDGELLSHDGAQYVKVGLGTDAQVLTVQSAGGPGVKIIWADPTGGGEVNTQTNLGGGAELGLPKNVFDLPLRTFISGDASVTFTPVGNTLDVRATGAGGGESNISTTPATVGANEADINMAKVGIDLQKRKLSGSANIDITQSADAITFAATDVIPDVLSFNGDLLAHDGTDYYRIDIGAEGRVLTSHPGAAPGSRVTWDALPAFGDVTGPASAADGNLASYNGTTGKLIADSGVAAASVTTAGAPFTVGQITQVLSGNELNTTGIAAADVVHVPVDTVNDELMLGQVGANRLIKNSGIDISDVARLSQNADFLGYVDAVAGVFSNAINIAFPQSVPTATPATLTINPGLFQQPRYHITGTGILTVNPLVSDGQIVLEIDAGVDSVTVAGGFEPVLGTAKAAGKAAVAVVTNAGGTHYFVWGSQQA